MDYLKRPMTHEELRTLIGPNKGNKFKFIVPVSLTELLNKTRQFTSFTEAGLKLIVEEKIFGRDPRVFMVETPSFRPVGTTIANEILIEVVAKLAY